MHLLNTIFIPRGILVGIDIEISFLSNANIFEIALTSSNALTFQESDKICITKYVQEQQPLKKQKEEAQILYIKLTRCDLL